MKKYKVIVITLILFYFSNTLFGQEIIDYDEIWSNTKNLIEYEGSVVYSQERTFLPNENIELMHGKIQTPDYYSVLYFIDDIPSAYWAHDCRYVFVNIEDNSIEVLNKIYPPKFLKEMNLLTPEVEKEEGKLFDFSNIQKKDISQRSSGTNYAVVISNGSEVSFKNDCQAFNSTLKSYYGYLESNIYNLIGNGSNYGSVNVDYSATLANISTVFTELANKMTDDDRLFIYVMDHGGPSSESFPWDVFVSINNDELTDYYLADELDKIGSGKITTIIGSCNGGGFLDNLATNNRIVITASKFDELAWDDEDSEYGEFEKHFIAALIEQDVDGNPVNADANDDNSISIREAFYYAKGQDVAEETPQYNSQPGELGYQLTMADESGTMTEPEPKTWIPIEFKFLGDNSGCNPLHGASPEELANHPWKQSHGSPKYLNSYSDFIYLEAELISGDSQKSEGTYLNLNEILNWPSVGNSRLNGGHEYECEISGDLNFDGELSDGATGAVFLEVYATNGLESNGYNGCGLEELPEITDKKLLLSVDFPNGTPNQTISVPFDIKLDKDEKYEQLWIYAYQASTENEGGVEIASINIIDKGVYVPIEEEEKMYNIICCDQTIVESGNPEKIIGNNISGTFKWQKRTEEGDYEVILGETGKDYDPKYINQTMYYRRVVSNKSWGTPVTVKVIPDNCSPGIQCFTSDISTMKVSHGRPGRSMDEYYGRVANLRWDFNNGWFKKYRESEGVYTDYKFIKGSSYLISFLIAQNSYFSCDDNLKIYAASNIDAHIGDYEVPSSDKKELIWKGRASGSKHVEFMDVSDAVWDRITVRYTPNDNYNHIWIYPYQDEWKCSDTGYNNYLIAGLSVLCEEIIINSENMAIISHPIDGENISTSGVVNLSSGEELELLTTNRISLNQGFKATQGSDFHAKYDESIYIDCGVERSSTIVSSDMFKDVETDEEESALNENPETIDPIEQKVTIFPNPTNGVFTVDFSTFDKNIDYIQVYNVSGLVIYEKNSDFENMQQIDLSSYPIGIYFVKVLYEEQYYFNKIIKQ